MITFSLQFLKKGGKNEEQQKSFLLREDIKWDGGPKLFPCMEIFYPNFCDNFWKTAF